VIVRGYGSCGDIATRARTRADEHTHRYEHLRAFIRVAPKHWKQKGLFFASASIGKIGKIISLSLSHVGIPTTYV